MKTTLIAGVLVVASISTATPQSTQYQDSHYRHQDSHYYEHKQTKKKTVERVGGGAAVGAVGGALLGGGKGAIGAGAGAGVGALVDHHKRTEAKKKGAEINHYR